jgi:hypothetical protein
MERKIERERERELEVEHCGERVTAWAINVPVGQIFVAAREGKICDLIKVNVKIISKNLDGLFFPLGNLTFRLSVKLSICHIYWVKET